MVGLQTRLDRLTGAPPAAFWWLWGGSFVSALATFVLPFLSLYLRSRGFSVEAAGRVSALYGVGMVVASPTAGSFADRFGRRPTMVAALLCAACATTLLAFAVSPLVLSGTVFFVGASTAAYRSSAMAFIADVVTPSARTCAYGMLRWSNNLGVAVSSLLGGALAAFGYGRLFLVDASTTLAFVLIIASRIPETRPLRPTEVGKKSALGSGALFGDRTFLALLVLEFAFILPLWQFQVALPLTMAAPGHGPAVFGRVLSVNGVLITLLQPKVAAWTQARDPARVLSTGVLLVGLGYGSYLFCRSALAFAVATGCGASARSSSCPRLSPPWPRSHPGNFGAATRVPPASPSASGWSSHPSSAPWFSAEPAHRSSGPFASLSASWLRPGSPRSGLPCGRLGARAGRRPGDAQGGEPWISP